MSATTLAGLPAYVPAPGDPLWRVYRVADPVAGSPRGPWYFAAVTKSRPIAETGRFDLTAPDGTCYLGDTPQAAYKEHFQAKLIDPDDERGRALACASPRGEVRIGDLASEEAEAIGVSLVEATTRNRRATQNLARQVRGAGFDGIRHLRRSDPTGRTYTYGLFGSAGAHANLPGWDTKEGLALQRPAGITFVPRSMPLAAAPIGIRRP